jgi:beta-mannosidase
MIRFMDLGGTWRAKWYSGQRGNLASARTADVDERYCIDAQVPGEIHLDVMKAGWIQDTNRDANVLAARWVEEMLWAYRRAFQCPPQALKSRAWLAFAGLDLVAAIYLNGKKVGGHRNSFYPCRIDITGKLKAGENLLTVELDSGLFHAGDRNGSDYLHHVDAQLHKRHWLRKVQSSAEWDWAPRLYNVGIFKPVRLEWTRDAARADQFVPLAEVDESLKSGTVRGRWFVEGLGERPVKGSLRIEVPELKASRTVSITIRPGLNPVEASMEVKNPQLWWPVGQGEPRRYKVYATLTVGGRVAARAEASIGFRRIRFIQDPHPEKGRYFILEVNNRNVFCKGGNMVPADTILARLDRERYDKLTDLALEANFNFLRVWGGGLYESDDFFDLCDAKGILVWQEFIFACSRYPVHDLDFVDEVKREARWNIRRLAAHPSLIAWCGNNEIETAEWGWGWDKKGLVMPDHGFFHITLPRLMSEEDPTRYYQPSSPFSPDSEDPSADHTGDQHPWSLGFTDTDFRKYRQMICRFANEGGFLGPTSLKTVLACLPEGQRTLGSFAWQVHDNAIAQWHEPSYVDRMMNQWLGKDVREMTVEDYVYWGGLVQGEALREYCDVFRRRMYDSAAAVFWMYNDVWPATRSWTIVDYYLRRTPAFCPVRRSMAMISVVVAEQDDQVIVFGINDTPRPMRASLRYGVFEFAGCFPIDRRASVTLKANASTPIARFTRRQWTDPTRSAAFAMLTGLGGTLLARNRLILPMFKELHWPKPALKVESDGKAATFTSPTFAWGVCLDLDGERPLADNFFDVWPGVPYSLPWSEGRPPQVIRTGNLTR